VGDINAQGRGGREFIASGLFERELEARKENLSSKKAEGVSSTVSIQGWRFGVCEEAVKKKEGVWL
jgi:hypothetical protein